MNELQGLKLTIKRLHLLTLAAAGGPELCEELTSVSTASHHETLMLGVVDETDDHVESSLAHVLPNRLGDIIWASRKVKELSIADRRAAVQNESLRALLSERLPARSPLAGAHREACALRRAP